MHEDLDLSAYKKKMPAGIEDILENVEESIEKQEEKSKDQANSNVVKSGGTI